MARYEPTFKPEDLLANSKKDVSYEPSDVSTPHPVRRFDRYPPWHAKPHGRGFPTLVCIMFSSFTYSHRAPNGVSFQLSPGSDNAFLRVAYEALREGVQVIFASVTVARGGSTGNSTSEVSYDPTSDLYEASYDGNGVFVPPGENPQSDSTAPFEDFDRPMAIKDIMWIVQHLKENAASLDVDPDNIVLTGSSAGGFTALWPSLQADLSAWMSGGADTQNAYSTKPKACIAWNTPTFMPLMKQATSIAHAFPTIADQDVPAATLDDVYPASTLNAMNYQWRLSPLHYAVPSEAVPTLLIHEDPSVLNQVTRPLANLTMDREVNFHGLRFGALLRDYLPSTTELIFSPEPEFAAQYAAEAARFANVDRVLTQENGNQQDELVSYVVGWILQQTGLSVGGTGVHSLPYGAARVNEIEVTPRKAGEYTRVLRRNPNRAGPVRVSTQWLSWPATQAQVRWTTDPSGTTLGVFQTTYGSPDGLGVMLLDDKTLDIGGEELWVVGRAATASASLACIVQEPTY